MNPIEELKARLDQYPQNLWLKDVSLKRNDFLSVKGTTDLHLYYVLSGSLRIWVEDAAEEHTIRFGYKDSFIASLDAFINERPSHFYIQAMKQSMVKVMHKSAFMEFVHSSPDNLLLWQKITEQLVYQQIEREIDLLTSSPLDRYRRVLERSPKLFQEIPHKYIASYLRMTPETLSRLKKS